MPPKRVSAVRAWCWDFDKQQRLHQCIAWVKEFPTGISLPAFGDGTPVARPGQSPGRAAGHGALPVLCNQQGQSGSYMNDSHTMDSAISDYASIESVRTMDKGLAACVPT